MDPSNLITLLKNVIQKAQQIYEQKKKNDKDCEYLIDHLGDKQKTVEDFHKMLTKIEMKELDEEQKRSWIAKQNRVEQTLKDFQNWITDRNKQCFKAWMCTGSQSEEISALVQRFDNALDFFRKFLDDLVKYQELQHLKAHTGHLEKIEENSNKQTDHLQKLVENTKPSEAKSIYDLSRLVEYMKNKYNTDPEFIKIRKGSTNSSVQEYYINLSVIENADQRDKEKTQEQGKGTNESNTTKEEIYRAKTVTDPKDILKYCKDPIRKILILGQAGIGKSTFCIYVVNLWMQEAIWNEYDLVILIQLRNLTKEKYSKDRYSVIDILDKEYSIDVTPTEDAKLEFKEQCRIGRILWILDGYDEFAQNMPTSLKGPFREIINQYHHIITSRAYAMDLTYDLKMEITGFNNDTITTFVKQYFKPNTGKISYESILNFLKSNPTIWGIAHIPINLQLICSTWSTRILSEKEISTVTDLYRRLALNFCLVYLKKKDQPHEALTDEEIEEQCMEHLEFFETVAYGTLLSNTIIIGHKYLMDIAKTINTNSKEQKMNEYLKIGLLKYHDGSVVVEGVSIKKLYCFDHSSFQEFLAARYLVRILTSDRQAAHRFIQYNKYNQRLILVFIFAFGLLRHQNEPKLIEDYWNSIENEAQDLIGLRHVKLLIQCLDEMNGVAYSNIRNHCVNLIVTWIRQAAKLHHHTVMRHLANSLTRSTTLACEEPIARAIEKLLQLTGSNALKNTGKLLHHWRIFEPSKELVSIMIKQLETGNAKMGAEICIALGAIEKSGSYNKEIEALLKACENRDYYVRMNACNALARIGNAEHKEIAIDTLLKLAKEAGYSMIRVAAFTAAATIAKTESQNKIIGALIEELKHAHPNIRNNACLALAEISKVENDNKVIDALLEALKDTRSEVIINVCQALAEIDRIGEDQRMIDNLLTIFNGKGQNIKAHACFALATIAKVGNHDYIIDFLLEALNDKSQNLRGYACIALGKLGKAGDNEKVLNALLAIVKDDREYMREALMALARIGKSTGRDQVVHVLLKLLNNDGHDQRYNASDALGELGEAIDINNEVIDKLLAVLKDRDRYIVRNMCNALGIICRGSGNNKVIEGLLNVMKNNFPMRSFAFNAFQSCINEFVSLETLDDEMIIALDRLLKEENCLSTKSLSIVFLRSYVRSNKKSWVTVIAYTSLLEDIALTIRESKIMVYSAKEPIVMDNVAQESLDALKVALQEQEQNMGFSKPTD